VIRIRRMTAEDIPLGMHLKQQAGWNQTEADWRRFLALEPDGCFVAEFDGIPAATLTTCLFGRIAWVAMVLVDPPLRGRGLASVLLARALAFLSNRGVLSVRLDATAQGRPLYEKLGFTAEYELTRYEGILPPAQGCGAGFQPAGRFPTCPTASPPEHGVAAARPEHLDGVVEFDQSVTATDRRKLLLLLYTERPDATRVVQRDGAILGYALSRPGTRAVQIGPCLATAEAGPPLLRDAFRRAAGQPVFIDIPTGNPAAAALAAGQGLTVQRTLLRMCRGPAPAERVEMLWASSGPEKG
jgi:GNAT superfamily N-acetyltransferase